MPAETRWIDAWIRWERTDDDEEEKEEEEQADETPSPPTDTFSFAYHKTSTTPTTTIEIHLQGFPSDSEQTWNSTGLTLWRSSASLCDYLARAWNQANVEEATTSKNLWIRNHRFLELGAGLGRSGILAWHCLSSLSLQNEYDDDDDADGGGGSSGDNNISDVTKDLYLTDGDTDVMGQLRQNVQENPPPTEESTEKDDSNMSPTTHTDNSDLPHPSQQVNLTCVQLLWGRTPARTFLQDTADGEPMDVIFGSDLVYVEKVITPLMETVTTLLAQPTGRFLMAHCARREGNEVTVDMVLEAAVEHGLQYDVLDQPEDDITLFCFRWKEDDAECAAYP